MILNFCREEFERALAFISGDGFMAPLIKRVVALEGDEVVIDESGVYMNGRYFGVVFVGDYGKKIIHQEVWVRFSAIIPGFVRYIF
ncbi:MAG: S26 family signal peptidase [Candidatus Margulisbacteria bacterium]|nr:S26 family signal peptidase [Candidatus Margulisiibacteriota bacterium]